MKLKSMDGGLTSTSSPDGINMSKADAYCIPCFFAIFGILFLFL
ncbi:MAG: hypothetical protein OSJ73_07145 [Lachnospiraceae bacterium]|nr:hypothetical protein [Lachnospiraceae bacterium]